MSFLKGKFNAPWNESIGMLKGGRIVSRRDSQTTSLTLNEFLESRFEKNNYKIGFSQAFQVGTKYGINPDVFNTVRKTPDQFIIATTGQVIHGEATQDIFGWSTSLSDDGLTMAVGSILNDGVNGLNSGSVRVYYRTSTEEAWIQKGVDIDGEAAQDYAGWSVSLSTDGDRLAIGAVFNDDGLNENTGHVRVFDWNNGTSQWNQVGIDINGGTSGDFFGYAVSMSADKTRIAIGAPHGLNMRGYVAVYYDNNGVWTKIADVEGAVEKGQFGKRIALKTDGSRLVVSAPKVGILYYYSVDSSQVNLLASESGPASNILFGHSLDFQGNTLIVADLSSLPLKIYDLSTDSFVSQAAPAGIFRSLETKVKLSSDGNTVVLSMPALNTEEDVINSTPIKQSSFNKIGLVRIYKRDGEKWKRCGWDLTSYARNNDEYGRSISVNNDGTVICVSAPRKDDRGLDRGCVTAYTVRPISYYVTPTITLLGLNPQPLQANTTYVEAGAVTDTGASVTISGEIENNTVEGQQYTVRYTSASAFDTSTVERTVIITKDPTVPVLTFIGDAVVKIPVNGVFNDPGVTSNIPATITTNSQVDYQTIGAYDIEYSAVSSFGIKSETLTRTVYIVYDIELESSELSGKITCMSKDGFIAATGDFTTDTVVLYEWSAIAPLEWKRIGQIIIGPDGSGFGAALDLAENGLTVAVGIPGLDNLAGAVRVYEYNFLVNAWERKGNDITDSNPGDKMGQFLCISGDGNTVSTGNFSPSGTKNPYVFTYRYSATTDTWTKINEYLEPFKLPVEVVSKQFSGSLDTAGSKLLLGVPVNNYATGAVFLIDLATGQNLVSIFGDTVGANLGQTVKLAPNGNTLVFGDVSAGCVKVYAANLATGFWSQLGDSITESYSSGAFGSCVDISRNGEIVTFSDPSTSTGLGKIYQYKWDGENWLPNMVEVNNNITGSFFGRKLFVTEDASKILTESTVTFQLFRWNVGRPTAVLNGDRLLRIAIDDPFAYNYVISSSNVVVTGQVNTSVTNDYIIKYTPVNDIGLSENFYQIVSVSGDMLQLGLDLRSFDQSATALNFGWSASMSDDGSTLAVGLPGYASDTGGVKIYEFDLSTGVWELQTTKTGPADSLFGYAVCMSKDGTRLAIGAPGVANGLVRVYNKNGTAWDQVGGDMAGSAGGKFGFSVSLNLAGTNVVVGEPRKAFDVNTGVGDTRMFSYTSSQWTEVGSMTNNQLEHELGHSVAVSSTNVFLSGAPMAGPGYVKLSSYIGGNVPIFAQPLVFGEKFGWAVTITNDGTTFAAGAPYYQSKTGRVLVYDATTTPPSLKGSPIVGEAPGSEFGLSVHFTGDGSKLMIHAGNGRVAVYTYNGSDWVLDNNEVITSEELDIKFGYALSSSVDGERLLVTAPLFDTGSGLVRTFSTRTSQIQANDFVGPTLTLNGPSSITHSQGLSFVDPGVRRDDLESGFTVTGTVDVNTVGTYTLTYTAQDAAGNPSLNSVSRTVTVIPVNFNNVTGQVTNALTNHNNASVQMSGDGTRFAVCSGVSPQAYISEEVSATELTGTQGTVTVYQIDDSSSPSTFTQVGQITDKKRFFATSLQLNQDGTKIAVMSTPDTSSAEITLYGIGNTTYIPLDASAWSRTDTYGEFNFALNSSIDITSLGINLFGRNGDPQSYRYKNMATSKDGSVIALGKPANGADAVSVYRRSGATVSVGSLASSQGVNVTAHTGLTATGSDISSDGGRIIFCDDETTFIYNTVGIPHIQEAAFTSTEPVNALSDNGLIAAVSMKKIVDYTPIILTGGDRVSIAHGSSWSDPGFVYTGSDTVTVSGSVDTLQQGEYIIRYITTKNVQVRIVNVEPPTENKVVLSGSHTTNNVPYGPGFAGWTGTWRSYDFTLLTVPSIYGDISNENFSLSITLNGTIPVAGNWQYQSIQIFTDGGFSSSIDFTSNGSEDGVSYSWSGSVYTNHTRTTTATPDGSLSGGDVIKGRLFLYNTYYSSFSVNVTAMFGGGFPVPTPTVTLVGLSENSIGVDEDFVDPGTISTDSVSTYLSPTFPQSTSCRKAIIYQATNTFGLKAYAVRYVGVETRPKVVVHQYTQNAWSQLGDDILTTDKNLDIYDTNLSLSELGTKLAISKYREGSGYIFTYMYDTSSYPPRWIQYGSTIEISGGQQKPGFSVALSGDGNRIVIGSPGTASSLGEVHVYNYNTGSGWVRKNQDLWTLTSSTLTTLGITNYSMDLFGYAVDISKDGASIIVGAPPPSNAGYGHVSVYSLSESADFIFRGKPLVRNNEPEFGRQVSITDNGLAFVTNAGASATSAGKLVKYLFENNVWLEFATVTSTVPIVGSAISEDGNRVLCIKDVVQIHTVTQTQVPGGGWDKIGQDITLSSIAAPGVDTHPSPSAGSRYSPGIFKPSGNTNVTGYVVDLSHDGNVLAVGFPFAQLGGGDPFVVNSTGAVAVFSFDGLLWNQVGGTIVPKYVYDGALTTKYDGVTSVTVLNELAEANTFSGADISLSGDGQFICVGSPGYLSNPIDLQPMDSLPNEGGMTFWTLYRRNSDWAPTNNLYNVGWEPVVRRDSELSESLVDYDQTTTVNEKKRELLGLGLKVSTDGSFVVFDTRTDGVKILSEHSGSWSVQETFETENTTFLVSKGALVQNMPHESTYTQAPGPTYGRGNFPAKHWPVSYISLSSNDKYLAVSQPLFDPLSRASTTTNQQVQDMRMGQVAVYKGNTNSRFKRRNVNIQQFLSDIRQNQGNAEETLNLYEHLTVAMSKDGSTIAIASPYGKLDGNGDPDFIDTATLTTGFTAFRSWIQVYTYTTKWIKKGALISPQNTGNPGNSLKLTIGQHIALSSNGSRMVVSGIKGENITSPATADDLPDHVHEVYIFDYDSGSATWITTSGDAANMEKIYIDASKRRYRGTTDWIYEDDRFVTAASLNGGTHKDAYQLGSISSVSISDDGTRIAVSTANYSARDFVAASSIGDVTAGTQKTSQCLEMVLIFEYQSQFHQYSAWEVTPPNQAPHGDVIPYGINVFPHEINHQSATNHWGAGIFSSGRTRVGWNTIDADARQFENVYITGGTHANWKLLHWELFKSELDLDGQVKSPFTRFDFDATGGHTVEIDNEGLILLYATNGDNLSNTAVVRSLYYNKPSGTFTQMGDDINIEENAGEQGDGLRLALDPDSAMQLIISAPLNDGNGTDSGNVRMRERYWGGMSWFAPAGGSPGTYGNAGDERGTTIGIIRGSPNYPASMAIVGSPNYGSNNEGRIEIWEKNIFSWPFSWTKESYEIVGNANENIGRAVALASSGHYIAVGVPSHNSDQGSVRWYFWNYGSPYDGTQYGNTTVTTGAPVVEFTLYGTSGSQERFGYAVAKSSERVTISTPTNIRLAVTTFPTSTSSAHACVRVYSLNTFHVAPIQLGAEIPAISNSTTEPLSVAMTSNPDRVAIGARHHNNNTGNVRVYEFSGGVWTLIFDVSGTVTGEKFGTSVALNSGDGTRLLVGGGPSSTKVSFFDIDAGGGTGPVTTRHTFWDGTGFKHKGIPHSIVSGLKFIQNDALLIERYDNATGGVITTREYMKGQTSVNHYEMRNYNANRYPSLLVFDSSRNLVTNRSTQSNGVTKTDWYGTAISSTTYPAFGDGVRWTHTYTVPTTTELTRDLNGSMSTRNNGWWINPVTGWMLLDFNLAPETNEDVPYSVGVSSPLDRVVFGIPQAAGHRGKIRIFDVSTEFHVQNINGVDYGTSRYVLTKVGDDIFGNALKGRFGESVSMSADGSRLAVGNRPFYREGTDANYDDRVPSKFYVYEHDVSTNSFNKTIEENLNIISSLENAGVGSRPTLTQFQFMMYDQLDDDVYSKWGRPACFGMKGIGIGTDNSNQEILELQQQVWVDSRYGKVDVTMSAAGNTVLVSYFNGFRLYDMGSPTSRAFSQIGNIVAGQPDTHAWNTDDFAYSYSSLSENGQSLLIPVETAGTTYNKELHVYDFNDEVNRWDHRTTAVFRTDLHPGMNFVSTLSNDRTVISSLYFESAQPDFRQYLISTTSEQLSYNKISSLTVVSTGLNLQQFPDESATAERLPCFSMSNDGNKIAIGNTKDTVFFSTLSDRKEMGSVGIFNYDSVNEEWNSQKISITDSATYVNAGFVSARFGKYLEFVKDGTSLIVSAPSSRDGQGDIFFFDTSSTTTTTQKAPPFTNPSGGSQNMFGSMVGISDDFTRLFVGDPGHNESVGRIIVTGYDGSSWGTPQYITRNGSPEGTLNTNVKFGQTFDISGDGDYLISSFFGEDPTNTLLDFVSYYNTNGGVDIAEVWQRNKDTNTWGVKSTIPLRLKTGTNIGVPQGVTSIPHQLGPSISANLPSDERFGHCVDCMTLGDGTLRFVASAIFANNNVGAVLVFDYDAVNNTWTQVGQTINGYATNGYFGVSVAIAQYTGTRVVIGQYNGPNPPDGWLEVFDYDTATDSWQLVGSRINQTLNNRNDDEIGRFVDISGDGTRVITGCRGHDVGLTWIPRYNKGAVYQYTYNGTSWSLVGHNAFFNNTGVGDGWFSERCAISADGQHRVLASVDANTHQGAVGVFRGTATTYTLLTGSIKYGSSSNDYFGSSVTINDDGSRFAAQAQGAGYTNVYEWDGNDYMLMGSSITGFATSTSYYDGRQSISLSSDGSRIAIGAQRYEVTRGMVKIYDWNGTNWNQFGDTIIGDLGEMLGSSVSLSPDGKKVVCGGRGANGIVKIYDLDPLGPHSHLQFLADNKNVHPVVKISDGGRYSLYGVAALPKLVPNNGQAERVTNQLDVLKNLHDTTPVMNLVGGDVINVAVFSTSYVDPGVTTDDPSDTVVVSGDQLDVNTVGTYVVRYTVTRFGLSNFVERTFNVFVPNDPPTLSLIGDANVSLLVGNSYTEPDPPVTFTGGALETYGVAPDGSVPGTFTVRYVVRNTLGVRSVERVITVQPDTTPPVLTIFGTDIVHKVNTKYRDPSFIGSDGNEEIFTSTPSYVLGIENLGQFRGVVQVTYSATDQAGNTGTQLRSVTVKDDFEASTVTTPESVVAISGNGNRVASVVGQDLSLHETGGALVNTWAGAGAQTVKLNSDGTIVAFTTSSRVFVYEYTSSWVERQPEAAYSGFGVPGATAFLIELSDDASTLAVSYPGGTTAFIEEVAVFRWNGTAYTLDYNQGSAESIGLGTSMSLKSDGTRLALGYPDKDSGAGSGITSTQTTFSTPSPTLNGVLETGNFSRLYKITSFGQYGQNNTMYWQLNLGRSWTVSWEWYIYGPRWGGADDMRMIYFAPNPITAYQASTHGGYNNFYEFWQGDTHQIRDDNDVFKKSRKVYYGTNRWLKVDVSYDNGVMTSTVRELYGRNRLVSKLSHDFGSAHESLYGQPLYFGFSGRTGGVSSSQYLRNINLNASVGNIGQISVFDRSGPSNWAPIGGDITGGLQNQKLGSVVKLSGDGSTLLNVNGGVDGNDQKISVFVNTGTWVKNQTLLDNVITRTTDANDGDDRVDISDDGSLLVYAKGVGTETYTTHPNGLTSKKLDAFKLDGGVYKHAMVIPNLPSASTQRVVLAGNKSKVLVNSSVFDITESTFTPVITLNQSDDVDPLVVSSYTEQGGVSSDGATVQIHATSETVLGTPGVYKVRYFTNTNAFRVRTVQII